jgi:hypothetical protein
MIREFYLFLLATKQSYRVVENEHLREFLRLSDAPKEISCISRKTVPRRFDSLYEISEKDLKSKLARQDAVSISCDCWTSLSMKQYLCIIVHFTDDNYTYSEYLLDFVKTTAYHTRVILGNIVFKALQDYGIEKKLLSISMDSGGNNFTLADQRQERFAEYYEVDKESDTISYISELFNGRYSLMRCNAHSTNTIVKCMLDALRAPDLTCEYLDDDLDDTTDGADIPEIGVDSEGFLLLDDKVIGNSLDSPVSAVRDLLKVLKYSPKMRSMFDAEAGLKQRRYAIPLMFQLVGLLPIKCCSLHVLMKDN